MDNNEEENKKCTDLSSPDVAKSVLNQISSGDTVTLSVNKEELLNQFNTFMIAEAYSQLPTILKLHELQLKCLDRYYDQVNELLDEDDANVFLLDKIITTLNNSIDRCNNIIMKLGLNSQITDQLIIQHIDNSQHINAYQSQVSKQRVLDTVRMLLGESDENNKNIIKSD